MSASKNFYESNGWAEKVKCERPILEVGTRFTITEGIFKIDQGTWEIIKNESAPYYSCRRVLKSGALSKTWSLSNVRTLSESNIYKNLYKQ
ncbi:hypothetical protein [Viridibacillus arvi]|uniref:hypothetical protein n=1 Tax=Viridibacillus arvi TaxID=263475 RepID=UPI00187B76BC|nr:hypothetical protein [Viridibacillus sp. JNUCC-6]QOV10947.1 hypothetical protein JNUCC6_20660 [Viridibacillus sp. JNUCC-6]